MPHQSLEYDVDKVRSCDSMDNQDHERTYAIFLSLVKWAVLIGFFLIISMAVGFMIAKSFLAGLLTFITLIILSKTVA
ncbi:aa3-type cytochrome c oxidase subunit IV [Candidatus Endowatersipora endosymbiont of Watersipora subatra]|uniref:aa3-type cytochrome c oxidase subunit IV n=1 Tax=Candidatus Endowatersipora endosymbiont of Watersipora subatra TaxID=3077946 RepID=UPI00312C9EC7